ncbi:hypothetical protein BC834DRAFT_603736 [Gloeopeniophorella convolvens]|nr:hypothetical protein BC834DRAFT_603736 [Gloeopeniophorella convolvens]
MLTTFGYTFSVRTWYFRSLSQQTWTDVGVKLASPEALVERPIFVLSYSIYPCYILSWQRTCTDSIYRAHKVASPCTLQRRGLEGCRWATRRAVREARKIVGPHQFAQFSWKCFEANKGQVFPRCCCLGCCSLSPRQRSLVGALRRLNCTSIIVHPPLPVHRRRNAAQPSGRIACQRVPSQQKHTPSPSSSS